MRLVAACLLVAAGSLSVLGCGSAPETGRPQIIEQPIVGGQVDDADKAAVALAFSAFGFFQVHCSGTLIAPNLVLTARHCVALTQNNGPQNSVDCSQTGFGLQAGGAALRATVDTQPPAQDGPDFYKGTGTVVVPPESTKICGNDIALITLEGAGMPASVATPIVPRIDSTPDSGEVYSAVGFGLTDPNNNSSAGTRMRLDDNVVSCAGTNCGVINQVEPTEWMGTSRTCPGDSGGPALDQQGRVIGVLSRGPQGCLSSVYGDVASHKDLIIQTALAAAKAGGYDPPFWAVTGVSTPPNPADDGGTDAGTTPPPGGALGDACDGTTGCGADLQCYSTNGTSGTCVASCATDGSCASGTTCDTGLGVCLADTPGGNASSGSSGGCSVVRHQGPAKPVPWLIGGLALALAALGRRRR